MKAILKLFREKQPHAKVLLLGPPPREDRLDAFPPALKEDLNPKVRQLNTLLAQLPKSMEGMHVKYLDFFDAYLDGAGKVKAGLLADKLHPAEAGYEIWAQAVVPTLSEWLSKP